MEVFVLSSFSQQEFVSYRRYSLLEGFSFTWGGVIHDGFTLQAFSPSAKVYSSLYCEVFVLEGLVANPGGGNGSDGIDDDVSTRMIMPSHPADPYPHVLPSGVLLSLYTYRHVHLPFLFFSWYFK